MLAEVVYQRLRPELVVGCFSTALLTASRLYGLPVARVGTELLLERLTPYQNSNRVPVSLVHALLPALDDVRSIAEGPRDAAAVSLDRLVRTIGFAMQPKIYPGLRPTAEAYLAQHLDDRTRVYFKKRRLTSLGLPGGVPARFVPLAKHPAARRVVRQARALRRTVLRQRAFAK